MRLSPELLTELKASETVDISGFEDVIFDFGINSHSHNKQAIGGFENLTIDWRTKRGTVADLVDWVSSGKAIMVGTLANTTTRRKKENIVSAQAIAIDIDEELSIEDCLKNPFVQKYAAAIYTSASHQKEKVSGKKISPPCDRYRVIFILPEAVTDIALYEQAVQVVMETVGHADTSCKDASRMFYGFDGTEVILCRPNVSLPNEFLTEVGDRLKREKAERARQREEQKRRLEQYGESNNLDELIPQALDYIDPDCDHETWLKVGFALHSHSESNFYLWDNWSSHGSKYPGSRALERQWSKFNGSGITIGSLFHIAKDYGYVAPAKVRKAYAKTQKVIETEKAIARFNVTPNLVISDGEKYLPDGIIPTDKRVVALKAPKECGKSYQQGKYIDLIRSMGLIPVQLSHSRNLSEEKAKEWGLTYIYSDAPVPNHFPENGVSLVVDSCLKLKQIPNIPYERLVILKDESEQVLNHITDSDTAIKRNRAAVMDFIGELLSRCHQVILADADLKTISIEWAKSLCGCGDRDVFIIEKKYKHNRTAIIFDDTPDLVVQITNDLMNEENIYNPVSGQKVDSILGSQTLETYFKNIAKSLIRVDADTNKDPSHPAYKITRNLEVLNEYQYVPVTPTLGTGVNIKGNHFTRVAAIATGGNPVESFLQQPARVRNDATRYIAVSSVANGQSQKYGGVTSVSELMLITGKHGDAIRNHLKDFGDFGDDWLFNPWVRAWAERTCLNNHLGKDYLGSVVALMKADGYRIERRSLCTKKQRKEIRALLKDNAIEKTQQYISDVLKENPLLGKALEASKSQNDKTYPERCAEEHGDILTLYGDDSEAIAHAHITGNGFYKKLQLHFWLQQSIESVRERDKRKLHYLKKDSQGKLFPNDIRKICITPKVTAIKKYRFDEVLARGYIHADCPILNEFKGILQDEIKRTEASLELGLGLDSCPKKSIASIAKWLLDNLFGLEIGDRRKQGGILIYPIESGDIPRDDIFKFWEQNMLTDELEQPDFTPSPEPMATAIAPESKPENRTDLEQLNFFIGKSDPTLEPLANKELQPTDHFFKNTGLSFPPSENLQKSGPNFTPEPAPVATAIAFTPETSPNILSAVQDAIISLTQGNRNPLRELCDRLQNFSVISRAAFELDQLGAVGMNTALIRLWMFPSLAIA